MGLFSVISFAANAASGSAGVGLGVMVVPALHALFYAGLEELPLNLYILAIEVDPLRDFRAWFSGTAMIGVPEGGFLFDQ